MITDPVLTRIGEAAQLHHHQGQREAARDLLTEIWSEIGGEQGDPLQVCVLAHTMADVQDNAGEELIWDLRALAVVHTIPAERMAQAGLPYSAATLAPSIHLNVCECYYKLGELDKAREHLRHAQAGIGALGDDDYGRLIKDGLARLTAQLG